MRYLTTTEAAAVLHVDPSRVRLLCLQGRIKTIRVGNTYAIPESELKRFAAIARQPGRPRCSKVASQQATVAVPFDHGVMPRQ
jgi:excisionase family DNA binding protein